MKLGLVGYSGKNNFFCLYFYSAYPMSSIVFTPIIAVYITKIGRKRSLLIGCVLSVINKNDLNYDIVVWLRFILGRSIYKLKVI